MLDLVHLELLDETMYTYIYIVFSEHTASV